MKPNFESHKQNQTNTWWQSAGFLFRTQIGLPLLTIEFLLVQSPQSALQRWRFGWSDKLTGFLRRDEDAFALVFLLSKLRFICIQSISKRIVLFWALSKSNKLCAPECAIYFKQWSKPLNTRLHYQLKYVILHGIHETYCIFRCVKQQLN